MKPNNALIILWNGNKIPDYLVEKIGEILITNGICIPEMLTIKYKDEDAISNAILKDVTSDVNAFTDDVEEALKNAIIYIGKRFEASLTNTNGNLTKFALELSVAVGIARQRISFNGINTGDEILNAVEIISTTRAIIPKSLAKKYHFNQDVVDVITNVYKNYRI